MSKHNFRRVSGMADMLHCAAERRIGPFRPRPAPPKPQPPEAGTRAPEPNTDDKTED